jgi:Domain of unknown function (DUF4381)
MAEAPAVPADPVAGLIDGPLPAPVSLWPQTWESRLVIVLVVVAIVAAIVWSIRWWYANRHRRAALAELDRIIRATPSSSPEALASALALLVRRTALVVFPREQIAALSGTAWLRFLDYTYDGHEFSQGIGRALATAPYAAPATQPDIAALTDLTRRWIRTHHD